MTDVIQVRTAFIVAACLALAALFTLCANADEPTSTPAQIPLCMVGDSITWAGEGDWWRKYLLDDLPRLAFVGSHSSVLGHSHAGEGGNSTRGILGRMKAIPDCPYYALLIGTNDNNIKDEAAIQEHARDTAQRIETIVKGLLDKPSVRKVFLGSVLPCHTDNPLRDRTNSATNVFLREKLGTALPTDRVVWVEYEKPIRQIDGWEPMIRLHPTRDGYRLIAQFLSDAIIKALQIEDPAARPVPAPGVGVKVTNLWDAEAGRTATPVIAGWYTLSFDAAKVQGNQGTVTVTNATAEVSQAVSFEFKVPAARAGERVQFQLFTGYEGYGYSRDRLKIVAADCSIERVLFEKKRPGATPSEYGAGVYVDTNSPPSPGELLVWPNQPGAGL